MATEKPVIRCFVSYPVQGRWTAPALVGYETARELQARGWWVLRDPTDERDADIQETYRAELRK